MTAFKLTVTGKAAPKSVTFTRYGNYNNKRVRSWMDFVRDTVRVEQAQQRFSEGDYIVPPGVPAGIMVDVYLPWPKNTPKKQASSDGAHVQKPDADNLLKPIMDALSEAGLWEDDNQVDRIFLQKWRCPIGQERAEITVSW
jgi:Holliday junction resolvase RusA-like endonuclease|tara:strand:+ start:4004 stop:4426 length:423 start_codon:yes stop_codon:yes gene_type:complete